LIVIMAAMVLTPVIGTIINSLYRNVTYLPTEFSFPENYLRLFTDPRFWQAVQFTLIFTVLSIIFEVIFGLLFALLLNEVLPGRGLWRVLLLLPWAIPNAVSARVWQLIYNYEFGVLNFIIMRLGISSHPVNWLGTQTGALAAVLISDIWKMTPFVTIILLAGLSSIPQDIYLQAMVDGANIRQRFIHITLFLIKPALVVAVLFRTIDAIRIFDLVYVLTGGGPGGGTTSLSLYAYNYYLSGDFGYGSAISVVVFLIAFVLALAYIRLGRFREAI
jgi:multiple sugar transport system permease protein